MNLWQDILKNAIVGTERSAFALPVRGDALGDVLAMLDANARENSLLNAAAAVALYERVGQLPSFDAQALPAPAEIDDLPRCSARAAQHLSLMLSKEFRELLPEWLDALAAAKKRVPEELLPSLLAHGKSNGALREAITKVIGVRGVWLAAQNSAWDFVVGKIDESSWETGTRPTRLALLENLRTTDPARARELVVATWNEEKPEDRAAFIETFIVGLSLADEPFLEAALDDRRKEVRKVAADLLARLPESALVKRMIARVKPLITYKKKLLGKNELIVELTNQCDKAMQRDGVEPKPPHPSIGEKAWWLQQVLGAVPYSYWQNLSGESAANLITRTPNEWRDDFLLGWSQAAIRNNDVEWIEALLNYASENKTTIDQVALIVALPPMRQEIYWQRLLAKSHDPVDGSLISRLLTTTSQILSEDCSRVVSQILIEQLQQATTQQNHWLRYYLQQFVPRLHPAVLRECLDNFIKLKKSSEQVQGHGLESAIKLLEFRLKMLKEITQ